MALSDVAAKFEEFGMKIKMLGNVGVFIFNGVSDFLSGFNESHLFEVVGVLFESCWV